jgi:hypothetical protein
VRVWEYGQEGEDVEGERGEMMAGEEGCKGSRVKAAKSF